MEIATPTLARKRHLHRRALRLEYFTVAWNVIEAIVAIVAGLIAGSVALIGFGADSGIEVISGLALLWRLRRADAEADADTEGHAESRALYAVAATFFLLACYIAVESALALAARDQPEPSKLGIALSVVSLAVMPALAFWKGRTGREMGSRALQADSVETWVCSYLSLALLVGVGARAAFGCAWADPVGALLMLPVILWQGWETLGEARE